MNILHALILGIVQGVGEFLPISSSGHLVVIPYIFGWDYQGLSFDIALHMGTLLALLIFFWRDWSNIIADAIKLDVRSQKSEEKSPDLQPPTSNYPKKLLWIILVGSIPAAIAGYLLESMAEHALRNPLFVAVLLAVFGLLLWLVDYSTSGKLKIKDLGYLKGFVIGVGQAIALFPGVSRSGSSITTGLLFGLDRESATRFSFLLATPAILGAFALSLKNFDPNIISVSFLVAFATSAAFGLLSIKFLLRNVSNHGFGWFAVYRIALAAVIMILYFSR